MIDKIVFYHNDCVDGFGAAFALWKAFGTTAMYVPCDYQRTYRSTMVEGLLARCDSRDVYIVDFSFIDESIKDPFDIMRQMANRSSKFIWIDHHKSPIDILAKSGYTAESFRQSLNEPEQATIILDKSRSGAYLTFQYLRDQTTLYNNFHFRDIELQDMSQLFKYVDDYDRYVFEFQETRAINAYINANKPWTFEFWDRLVMMLKMDDDRVVTQGELLLRQFDSLVDSIVEQSRTDVLLTDPREKDFKLLTRAVNCNRPFHSAITERLVKESGIGIAWYAAEQDTVKVRIATDGTYDASAIARQYGGGGHEKAAGFSMNLKEFVELFVIL